MQESGEAVVPYRIVVPSRRRSLNAIMMRKLVPTATITVEDVEMENYRTALNLHPSEDGPLVPHPPFETIAEIRNWCLDRFAEDCIVFLDDDLKGVTFLTGARPRTTRDPEAIRSVIENAVNVSADLGIAAFSWNRVANPMQYKSSDPLGWVGPLGGAWGIIGRDFRCDSRLQLGEDLDLGMQIVLERRIVLMDRRIYFDFGPVFTGVGGLQGKRTAKVEDWCRERLKARWKGHINLDDAKARGSKVMQVRVNRRSDIVSTRDGGIR